MPVFGSAIATYALKVPPLIQSDFLVRLLLNFSGFLEQSRKSFVQLFHYP